MSLLRDIQNTAVSSDNRITDLLRKCKVLAARLGNREFDEWIGKELQGYENTDELPSYRIIKRVEIKGHFSGAFGSGLRNASILPSAFGSRLEEYVSSEKLVQGISTYEQLLEDSSEGTFTVAISTELVAHFAEKMYQDMVCMQAWKVIPRGSIIGLIDSVRNSILSFALEIEKFNPDAGEAPVNSEPIPQSNVSQIFNTFIQGDVGTYSHSSGENSSVTINNVEGDLNQLKSGLGELGISDDEFEELKQALQDDESLSKKEIGNKTSSWMAKVISKASSGLYGVSMATATQVVPKLICDYLGLI